MKKYNDEIINVIISNIDKTSTELSKQLNIPASTIRSIRQRNGINLGFSIDEKSVVEMYLEIKRVDLVAEFFNIDRHTCSKILNKYNIKTNNKIYFDKYEIQNIINLCLTNSYEKVANLYNVSDSYIEKIYKENAVYLNRKKVIKNNDYAYYDEYFSDIDSTHKSYYLGLLASDGCVFIRENKNAIINLTLHNDDSYMLDLFAKTLGLNKKPYKSKSTDCSIFQIASKNG